MYDQIDPAVAAVLIPVLWAAAIYKVWISPALKKGRTK